MCSTGQMHTVRDIVGDTGNSMWASVTGKDLDAVLSKSPILI